MYTKNYIKEITSTISEEGKHGRFSIRILDKTVYFAYHGDLREKDTLKQDTKKLFVELKKHFNEDYIKINLQEGLIIINCCSIDSIKIKQEETIY